MKTCPTFRASITDKKRRRDLAPMAKGIEGRSYLERGKPVTVLARWNGKGPRNVLIKRCDGCEVIRAFRGLRKTQPVGAHSIASPTLPVYPESSILG
jgi:hypothetical protein